MKKLLIFLSSLFLLLVGYSILKINSDESKSSKTLRVGKEKVKIIRDRELSIEEVESRLFKEVHNIISESYFVVTRSRYGAPKTIFEIASKHLEDSSNQSARCGLRTKRLGDQSELIDLNCKTHVENSILAWQRLGKDFKIRFSYGAISHHVPVGLLEFKPFDPSCEVIIGNDHRIIKMSCKDIGMRFESKNQGFVFETLVYQSSGPLLKFKGKSFGFENDILSYESEVPLEGDIQVKLTDLRPKKGDVEPTKSSKAVNSRGSALIQRPTKKISKTPRSSRDQWENETAGQGQVGDSKIEIISEAHSEDQVGQENGSQKEEVLVNSEGVASSESDSGENQISSDESMNHENFAEIAAENEMENEVKADTPGEDPLSEEKIQEHPNLGDR